MGLQKTAIRLCGAGSVVNDNSCIAVETGVALDDRSSRTRWDNDRTATRCPGCRKGGGGGGGLIQSVFYV